MHVTIYHWIAFGAMIAVILGIDLWRSYRHPHPIGMREALLTSAGWISLALAFNIWIYFSFGWEPALNFFTGYLLEKSLSVDNLFIFLLIFSHFKVPEISKHQILFYGVLGAVVLRALLIWGGIELVQHFEWIFIVFGLFLIFTGIQLAIKKDEEQNIEKGLIYRWLQKRLRFTSTYHGNAFFMKQDHLWMATPLFGVLLLIEFTDLLFAIDSVPAILGITTEPFIVFTSNIFAIMGLRSLFFALEGMMKRFHLIHYALAFILVFIGCKMIVADILHIPTWIALMVIVGSLTVAIVASNRGPSSTNQKK